MWDIYERVMLRVMMTITALLCIIIVAIAIGAMIKWFG